MRDQGVLSGCPGPPSYSELRRTRSRRTSENTHSTTLVNIGQEQGPRLLYAPARVKRCLDPLGRLPASVVKQLADDLPDPLHTREQEVVDEGDRPPIALLGHHA